MGGDILHYLDAEPVLVLSRAEYDQTRRNLYAVSGIARDDERLPKLWPPGSIQLTPAPWKPSYGGTDVTYVTPASERRLAAEEAAYDTALPAEGWTSEGRCLIYGGHYPVTEDICRNAGGTWESGVGDGEVEATIKMPDIGGAAVAARTARMNARRSDGTPMRPAGSNPAAGVPSIGVVSDAWWYETSWGRARVVLFTPPVVRGFGQAWQPAVVTPLPSPDLVVVPNPHPYLVGLPPLSENVEVDLGTGEIKKVPSKWAERGWRTVLSEYVVTAAGHRQGPLRTAEGWRGSWFKRRSDGFFDGVGDFVRESGKTVERIGRNFRDFRPEQLERIAAALIAGTASGSLVGGLLAAGQLLASDDPWRDLSRTAAASYAIHVSPLTKAAESFLATIRTGMTGELPTPVPGAVVSPSLDPVLTIAGVGEVATSDVATVEVFAHMLMAVSPDEAQRVLEKIAKNVGYVDLVFARLVIEAQKDDEKREALKAALVVRQAEFWERYGQHIVTAMSTVLEISGVGAAAGLLLELAAALYQAAIVTQALEVQAEAARRLERELEAELAAIEASTTLPPVLTPGVLVLDDAPESTTQPSDQAARLPEPWFVPLLRASRTWIE